MGTSQDYREYIRSEFTTRIQKNARYSLRAFARDLGMSPANLSGILKGTHGMSRSRAILVAGRLGFREEVQETFCDLVDMVHARSPAKRVGASKRIEKVEEDGLESLDVKDLDVLQNWHEFALLELLNVPRLARSLNRLGNWLRLSSFDLDTTVRKLLKLQLVRLENGILRPTFKHLVTKPGITSLVARKLYTQLLKQAGDALHFQGVDQREFSSSMLLISRSRLPEAKEELRRMRKKFIKEFQVTDGEDIRLYAYCFQLFDLLTNDLLEDKQ